MYDYDVSPGQILAMSSGMIGIALIVLFFMNLVFAIFCAWLAAEKDRSQGWWFLWGILFGFIALVALGCAPGKYNDAQTIIAYLEKRDQQARVPGSSPDGINLSAIAAKPTGDTWVCKTCHERNPVAQGFCSGCGTYK